MRPLLSAVVLVTAIASVALTVGHGDPARAGQPRPVPAIGLSGTPAALRRALAQVVADFSAPRRALSIIPRVVSPRDVLRVPEGGTCYAGASACSLRPCTRFALLRAPSATAVTARGVPVTPAAAGGCRRADPGRPRLISLTG